MHFAAQCPFDQLWEISSSFQNFSRLSKETLELFLANAFVFQRLQSHFISNVVTKFHYWPLENYSSVMTSDLFRNAVECVAYLLKKFSVL